VGIGRWTCGAISGMADPMDLEGEGHAAEDDDDDDPVVQTVCVLSCYCVRCVCVRCVCG